MTRSTFPDKTKSKYKKLSPKKPLDLMLKILLIRLLITAAILIKVHLVLLLSQSAVIETSELYTMKKKC
jgi:hypothetical protein